MTTRDSFTFDDTKIQSLDLDEQKVVLFQWISSLEKDLAKYAISNQNHLEQLLLKYLAASSPKPNQATRRLIARCFIVIYSKGDQRTLFDTVVSIQSMFLNRKIDDVAIKLAGIHCLGALMEEHGSKVMSLFAESVSIVQKILRNAKDAEISLRHECIKALTSCLKGAGKGASDALSKELFRIAKNGTYDKLPLIKRISFELMEAIYNFTVYIPPLTLSEYDAMIVSIAKYVDSGTKELRNSAASAIATLLVKSQNPIPKQALKKDESPSDQPILSISDMLSLLTSCYLKSTGTEAKSAIAEGFAMFFRKSGLEFAESNYSDICRTCIELASHTKLQNSKSDCYISKKIAGFLLHDVIGRLLSETGQLNACRHLGNELKRENISDAELNFIISELGALLSELGPAAYPIQSEIVEPLLLLISRNTNVIKVTLACCLRDLCLALPQNITRCMNRLVIAIQRGIPTMSIEKPETIDQVIGYGNILSAIIGIISSRPLFAAYEDAATIFGLATQLIKTHTNAKDYRVMSSQAQIGWTLVGSLMSLGPNFVKVHLSQLLLIWKNSFQKNQPKDAVVVRGELEWGYLLTSKESALVALQSFISFNGKEISNSDISKRIFVCLNNTLQFLATLIGAFGPVDDKPPTPSQVALYEKECDLRRRLFECFKLLSPCSIYESIYTPLVRATLDVFAMDPDKPDRFLATIGSRDGVFFAALGGKDSAALIIESVSPTSLAHGSRIIVAEDSGAEDKGILKHKIRDAQFQALDDLIEKAPQKAFENDPHCLYLSSKQTKVESKNGVETIVSSISKPVANSNNLVNAAIELFSLIFPHQNVQTQETVMEQIIKSASYSGGKISSNRKFACQINSLVAVIGALKYVAAKKGQLASPKVAVAIRDLMLGFVKSSDSSVRLVACEIAGRIARISGNSLFINSMIQDFVDKIINNRDPDVRAGSCLALGSIYHFVGGMAAGSHLRTCVEIFHSLATDQHHHVHTWALHALHLTIESAGLMYGPFINSSLSLTAKLFMAESHEPASSSANLPGIEGNSEIYPTFGRILNALIGVVGPELQDSSKLRVICFTLFDQLKNDADPLVVVEAIRCIQNFIIFSPKYLDIPVIIPFLQKQLIVDNKNQISIVRTAAITCLYQLTQKNPESVLGAVMDNCLEEQLFALLDIETDSAVLDEIKDILLALLKHVGPSKPSRWIDLCKSILSRSGVMDSKASAVNEAKTTNDDEDGEEIDQVASTSQKPVVKVLSVSLLPRWRTQVFSLKCVKLLIEIIQAGNRKEDFDLAFAKAKKIESPMNSDFLIFRIGDLIRMAFNSSTGSVSYLRLSGLKLLEGIIESYSQVPDPDFLGHRLLEQYEAQIISALAPGFEADATPDITNDACHVTAYFLCSGIIQDISPAIRPVKLLTNFLDQFVRKDYKSNGRTPNAQLVIKLAVLSSWASIYSKSSINQRNNLFSATLHKLFSLWFGVLKEYCLLGDDAEQENLLELNGPTQAKSLYGTATKDVIFVYYKKSWLIIMEAIGNLIEEKASCILGLFPDTSLLSNEDFELPNPFFTVMGLCVHELSLPSSGVRTVPEIEKMYICIKCIKQLLSPHVIGKGILPDELTNELLSIFDKLSQTENILIQELILDTLFHLSSILSPMRVENELKIFRIIFNFFANQIPILSSNPSFSSNKNISSESGILLSKACDFLKKLVETAHLKSEASAIGLILSSVLFSDVRFVNDTAPKLLLVLKACLNLPTNQLSLTLLGSLVQSLILSFESFSVDISEICLSILKNISLAIVLCISLRPEIFSHSLLIDFTSIIFKLMSSEVGEAKLVAVQASRAILMLSSRSEAEIALIGSAYCRILYPTIFSNTLALTSNLDKYEANLEIVEENLKTFLIVAMAQSNERSKFLNLLLMVNMYLDTFKHIKLGTKSSIKLQSFIGTTFVQLASQNSSFKAVVQELGNPEKALLESILKQELQNSSSSIVTPSFGSQNVEEAPRIKLKMFG